MEGKLTIAAGEDDNGLPLLGLMYVNQKLVLPYNAIFQLSAALVKFDHQFGEKMIAEGRVTREELDAFRKRASDWAEATFNDHDKQRN